MGSGEIKPSLHNVSEVATGVSFPSGVRLHNKEGIVMTQQETVQISKEMEKELTLLRGFRDLLAERTGYYFGTKALGKTMSEKTEAERKDVRTASKGFKDAVNQLIEKPTKQNSKEVKTCAKALEQAKEANKKARKPHMQKISPLRKAIRYIDTVAVPDSLKELGKPVNQPIFSLSDVIKKAIA